VTVPDLPRSEQPRPIYRRILLKLSGDAFAPPRGELGISAESIALMANQLREIVSLGVQTQAGSAQQALQENANKMTAVLSAISGDGIGKDDIATSGVNLYPNYGQSGNTITGYQASNQVDVTVRDMSKVGSVIDDAVGAGANLANGITFQLSDQNAGLNDALAAAVADAKTKAQTLATAGGAQLGQVVSIREDSAPQPPIYFDRAFASAGAVSSAPTPVNPPTIQTQVSVTVVWSLA